MATVFERLKKIIVHQLDVEEERVVSSASFIEDLEADSLDMIEIIMAIEDEFSDDNRRIQIPDEDAERLLTVQDMIDYLENLKL